MEGPAVATLSPRSNSNPALTASDSNSKLITDVNHTSHIQINSLLRLFESDFFNVWMCVLYIYKYANNVGIIQYLSTRLFDFRQSEVEQFLPQLCNLYFYASDEAGDALSRFLIDCSCRSLHFALRLWWLLDATALDNQPSTLARATKLRESIETAAINSRPLGSQGRATSSTGSSNSGRHRSPGLSRPKSPAQSRGISPSNSAVASPLRRRNSDLSVFAGLVHSIAQGGPVSTAPPATSSPGRRSIDESGGAPRTPRTPNSTGMMPTASGLVASVLACAPQAPALTTEMALQISIDKHRRCTYFNEEIGWIRSLCEASTTLKNMLQRELRKAELVSILEHLQENLPEKRVYLPLKCTSDAGFRRVMRLLPEHAIVLNSRERAPYMLMVETVDWGGTCANPNLRGAFGVHDDERMVEDHTAMCVIGGVPSLDHIAPVASQQQQPAPALVSGGLSFHGLRRVSTSELFDASNPRCVASPLGDHVVERRLSPIPLSSNSCPVFEK